MFRASQSIEPANSRVLQEKWDAKTYSMHRQRVRAARSTVDTKQPPVHPHLRSKARKSQEDEIRYAHIEKDNRRLLEHMLHIMNSKGRVDHHNDYHHRSTNSWKRQMELDGIAQENYAALRRINAQRPVYSTAKWEAESKKHQDLVAISSRYTRNRRRQPSTLDRLPGRSGFPSSSELSFSTESTTSRSSTGRQSLTRTQPLPPIESIPEDATVDI